MERGKSPIRKYWKQYKWSNIRAMMKNNKSDPKICNDDFEGRLMVITGGTSGIGYYTCRKYASHGARILSINRNREKSESLCDELKRDFGVQCSYMIADFSSLDDSLRVGKELSAMGDTIDVLIHNAGVFLKRKELTKEGFETTFVVNYLSSFVINYLIREKMKAQGRGRILMVNSEGHRFAVWGIETEDLNWQKRRYSGLKAYGSAKTCQLLSMLIINQYFEGSGVTINAMHPGAVKTGTGKENGAFYKWYKRNVVDRFSRTPEISAEALYYLGVSGDLQDVGGKFFNLTTEEIPAPPALDMETAKKLWQKSLRMGAIDGGNL
ncbi:SDR family NAD(P)-dependent oxidoreductase [Mesotoga prima]|uniref:SDR family NAD(P)-dependent oxidoreductase n=1 Tax=Mesotoga prima TaxID=1184387 RepID=UPI002C4FE260|nr:SDR family NAD(P)-dependent oxidoreductase [Mesotoga prima]HOP38532.1 SDR family NAD(P)-dependent oxidoreductase [Mesotoga prima]